LNKNVCFEKEKCVTNIEIVDTQRFNKWVNKVQGHADSIRCCEMLEVQKFNWIEYAVYRFR